MRKMTRLLVRPIRKIKKSSCKLKALELHSLISDQRDRGQEIIKIIQKILRPRRVNRAVVSFI